MRRLCEDFQRIDVRKIDFQYRTTWQYPPPSEIAISVISDDAVHVIHGTADFCVPIERTGCNYGGSRPWFLCPRCGDRRAVLYDNGHGAFGCKRCLRLIYPSEAEDTFDRMRRKRRKLEARLGKDGEKPKWMRWRTYERIQWKSAKAEHDAVLWLVFRRM